MAGVARVTLVLDNLITITTCIVLARKLRETEDLFHVSQEIQWAGCCTLITLGKPSVHCSLHSEVICVPKQNTASRFRVPIICTFFSPIRRQFPVYVVTSVRSRSVSHCAHNYSAKVATGRGKYPHRSASGHAQPRWFVHHAVDSGVLRRSSFGGAPVCRRVCPMKMSTRTWLVNRTTSCICVSYVAVLVVSLSPGRPSAAAFPLMLIGPVWFSPYAIQLFLVGKFHTALWLT